jgi:hypothetical protein
MTLEEDSRNLVYLTWTLVIETAILILIGLLALYWAKTSALIVSNSDKTLQKLKEVTTQNDSE